MSKGKARHNSFERWSRRWVERKTNGASPGVDPADNDFDDFYRAAASMAGFDSPEARQVACIVYNMAMDYSEDHASAKAPNRYRLEHA